MLTKRGFTGGMDSDSDARYIEQEDWTYALNIRASKTDQAAVGTIENVAGNQIVNYQLPAGTNQTIGSYYNKLTNKVYYFVYNSNNNHLILEYNVATQTITQILIDQTLPSVLNFSPTRPILHIDIIEDLMYWTDGYNEPCYINLENAKTGVYNYNSKQYVQAIQYAPQRPPAVVIVTDAAKTINNIKGKTFQFRTNFIYDDNQSSAWSPISIIPISASEQFFNIEYTDLYNNNAIEISFLTGIDKVKKINLAVRNGNTGDFFLVKTFDKEELSISNNSTHSFRFFNDGSYTSLFQAEVNRLFDYVPIKAGAQSLTRDRRITYGDITEGYDNIEVDMDVTPVYNVREGNSTCAFLISGQFNPTPSGNGADESYSQSVLYTGSQTSFIQILISAGQPLAKEETISLRVQHTVSFGGTQIVSYADLFTNTFPIGTTKQQIAAYFANEINNSSSLNQPFNNGQQSLNFTTTSQVINVSGSIFLYISYNVVGGIGFTSSTSARITFINEAAGITLKRASAYSVGLIYRDAAGRSTLVQPSGEDIFIKPYNETPSFEGNVTLDLTIRHTPPPQAVNYQFLITDNGRSDDYLQIEISSVVTAGTEYKLYIGGGSFIGFSEYNNLNNNKTQLVYTWSRGDRIWFLRNNTTSFYGQYIDVIINNAGTDGTGYYITVDSNIPIVPVAGGLIEVYTPKLTTEEKFFWEVGEVFDITNGFHQGNEQNQNGLQPAILNLNIGDSYYRYRGGNYNTFVEDLSISDFYLSKVWNRGRPNIVDAEYKQTTRPTTIYYSEKYIPETNINGLSMIFDSSFESYGIEYGAIKKLYSEDGRLLVFQQLKTGQVLVNEETLFDTSGNVTGTIGKEIQVLSPRILYFKGEYGIGNNPESFAVYGGAKYHLDALNGMVMRLSNDGYTPISEYKMHNYFKNKCKALLDTGRQFFAWGVYDNRHNEYVLSFSPVIQPAVEASGRLNKKEVPAKILVAGETVAFSEDKNRWVTFYSFLPENMVMTSKCLVSFSSGQFYTHDSDVYNKFFNVQYDSEIEVVGNNALQNVKFWHGIEQESTSVWVAPEITTPPSADYTSGQLSNLVDSDFEMAEGVFYAAFLKDQNTPNVTDPLLNGDDLRSATVKVKLRNSQTVYVRLFAVGLRSGYSYLVD